MTTQTACGILNELAKNNKITPIYSTSEEKGPPHQKTFKVSLHLPGYGTYEGHGLSIKEAKNKAADAGLQSCTLSGMGPVKTAMQISPTVELNILSMRSGEAIEFKELDPGHIRNPNPIQQYDKQLIMGGIKSGGNMPIYRQFIKIFRVAVHIMGQAFTGEGKVKQEARNNAARKALIAMSDQLMLKASQNDKMSDSNGEDNERNEIGKLHEVTARHQLKPSYEVVKVTGPSHLMKFSVKCTVGDKETMGEGIRKKIARKIAAKKMLDLLGNSEDFEELPDASKKHNKYYRKFHRSASKTRRRPRPDRTIDIFLDPITYLTQLMQLRKEPAPTYTLVQEKGGKNVKQFKIQVSVGDSQELIATGIGPSKKEAKRIAADSLLKICGIDQEKIRESENEVKKAYMSAAIGKPKSAANPVNKIEEEKPSVQMLNRAPGAPVKTLIKMLNGESSQMSRTERLQLCADREGLRILYNDYGRRTEAEPYASHVTVFTVPHTVSMGIGWSMEAAREDAAAKALVSLNQSGFAKPNMAADKDQ